MGSNMLPLSSYKVGEYVLILATASLLLYMCFLATVCVRLWIYKGDLGPAPRKFYVPAGHVRSGPRSEMSSASASKGARGLEMDRFTGRTLVDADEADDAELRRAAVEERRISRLNVFEQDDCGDGANFPDVPLASQAPVQQQQEQEELRPPSPQGFREEPRNYMTMGLRKLDSSRSWLRVDDTYRDFHAARATILRTRRDEVIQVVDRPQAHAACEELLEEVVAFLTGRYSAFFETFVERGGRRKVRNKITREEFYTQRPWSDGVGPLEVCARLAMEDFNILVKDGFTGSHYLVASATLFPAGWRLRSRIGKSVTDLHGPVPLWEDIPDVVENSYLSRLHEGSCMQRSSFFVQVNPEHAPKPLHDLLFVQEGKDFFPGSSDNLKPWNIVIRRERQTFRRLPRSDAVVFTVKTSVEKLVDVPEVERPKLVREFRSWPREIAVYKGRDLWQRAVVGFCERRPAHRDLDLFSDVGSLTRIDDY